MVHRTTETYSDIKCEEPLRFLLPKDHKLESFRTSVLSDVPLLVIPQFVLAYQENGFENASKLTDFTSA